MDSNPNAFTAELRKTRRFAERANENPNELGFLCVPLRSFAFLCVFRGSAVKRWP